MNDREYNDKDIIFIEYNGVNRPFRIYTFDLAGYDFFYKDKYIQCKFSSLNISPFLNTLVPEVKKKGNRKIWFNDKWRPYNNEFGKRYQLSDKQITKMGYLRIENPKYIDEILEALND